MSSISVTLRGISDSLEQSLEKVRDKSLQADETTESLQNTINSTSRSSSSASTAINSFAKDERGMANTSLFASSSLESLNRSISEMRNKSLAAASVLRLKAKGMNAATRASLQGAAANSAYNTSLSTQISQLMASTAALTSNTLALKSNNSELGVLAKSLKEADFTFGNLSLNIGAFTIALKELGTQIPVLLTLFGSMASALVSLGGAAVAAGGALGAMFGGGLLALAQKFKEEVEGINSIAEATQKIFSQLGDMFMSALEPLMTQTNIHLFKSAMRSLAGGVNVMAQSIMQLESELLTFASTLSDMNILTKVINSLQYVFIQMDDTLLNFIESVVDGLPSATKFFVDTFERIRGAGGSFTSQLREFAAAFIELGTTIASGALPMVEKMFTVLTELVSLLNELNPEVIKFIAQIIGLSIAIKGLSKVLGPVGFALSRVTESLTEFNGKAVGAGSTATQTFAYMKKQGKEMSQVLFSGFTQFGGAIKDVDTSLQSLRSRFMGFATTAKSGMLTIRGGFTQARGGFSDFVTGFRSGASKYGSTIQRSTGQIINFSKAFNSSTKSAAGAVGEMSRAVLNGDESVRQLARSFYSNTIQAQKAKGGFDNYKGSLKGAATRANSLTKKVKNGARAFIGKAYSIYTTNAATKAYITSLKSSRIATMLQTVANKGLIGSLKSVFSWSTLTAIKNYALSASYAVLKGAVYLLTGVLKAAWLTLAVFTGQTSLSAAANYIMSSSIVAAISSFAGYIASIFTGTVALSSLTLSSIAATISTLSLAGALTYLNSLLAGIPLIIGTIVTGLAALVGIVGNAGGKTKAWGSAVSGLKNVLRGLVEVTLSFLIPIWNLVLMPLVRGLYNLFSGFMDGVKMLADAFGLLSGSSEETSIIFKVVNAVMEALGKAIGYALYPLTRLVGFLGTLFGDIMRGAARILAEIIHLIVGLSKAFSRAIKNSEAYQKIASVINNVLEKMGEVAQAVRDTISDFISGIKEDIADAREDLIDFIDLINRLPGVDIGGVEQTVTRKSQEDLRVAREDLSSDSDESDDDVPSTPEPNFNYEDITTNNVEVDADSDKEDRIKMLVEDALDEANRFRRARDGVGL